MFLLDVIGGTIVGTGIFTILNKLFNFTSSKIKRMLGAWLACFFISAITIAIIVKLISGVVILLWVSIKILAVCLVAYGLYSGWKKLFNKF